MNKITSTLEKVYSSVFEPELLNELKAKSMQIIVSAGQTMINVGQTYQSGPTGIGRHA